MPRGSKDWLQASTIKSEAQLLREGNSFCGGTSAGPVANQYSTVVFHNRPDSGVNVVIRKCHAVAADALLFRLYRNLLAVPGGWTGGVNRKIGLPNSTIELWYATRLDLPYFRMNMFSCGAGAVGGIEDVRIWLQPGKSVGCMATTKGIEIEVDWEWYEVLDF